jgi:hypothetical protein
MGLAALMMLIELCSIVEETRGPVGALVDGVLSVILAILALAGFGFLADEWHKTDQAELTKAQVNAAQAAIAFFFFLVIAYVSHSVCSCCPPRSRSGSVTVCFARCCCVVLTVGVCCVHECCVLRSLLFDCTTSSGCVCRHWLP